MTSTSITLFYTEAQHIDIIMEMIQSLVLAAISTRNVVRSVQVTKRQKMIQKLTVSRT
jgi:hypothetical protein